MSDQPKTPDPRKALLALVDLLIDGSDMTDEEVRAELIADGIDPDAAWERLKANMKAKGFDLEAKPSPLPGPQET